MKKPKILPRCGEKNAEYENEEDEEKWIWSLSACTLYLLNKKKRTQNTIRTDSFLCELQNCWCFALEQNLITFYSQSKQTIGDN